MRAILHPGPREFLDRAREFLDATEVENNVAIGIAHRAIRQPGRHPEGFRALTVEDGGRVVGTALQTPPWPLLISDLSPGATDALIPAVRGIGIDAITGPEEPVRRIAAGLGRTIDGGRTVRQRLYELREAPTIPPVTGRLRAFTPQDRPLLKSWVEAFLIEVRQHRGPAELDRMVDFGLAEGSYFLWEDGLPVSMANRTEMPPRGFRIGAVYTPPELRRRGYAGTVVGSLSRRCLDEGRAWCCLFTDLANPTSNSVYMKVGYRPVRDIVGVHFADPGRSL